MSVSRNGVVRAMTSSWDYDMSNAIAGAKMLLLTEGGVAVIGQCPSDKRGYVAWAPMPDRDKEREAALRLAGGMR